ncbi:MAG TPA: type II secretion system F family protein [Candidatus Ozemobacteraceae bacterium]|nr:type II secretion system F family protein [Candidatus Ozemobacteraceae bacterium]
MQLIFIVVAGFTALLFTLLLFSLFGSAPGEDVRARMEQYLVESEMIAKQYTPPDEDDEKRDRGSEDGEDDWVKETRGDEQGIKKLLGNVGFVLTPKGMAARIADKLAKAGVPLKANEFVSVVFLATIIPAIFGTLITQNPIMGLGLGVIGFFVPNLWVTIMKSQRSAAFGNQIQDALIMIANGLKAGYSLLQAMEMVAREAPPPMSIELRRVLKENSLGLNLEDALRGLNMRVENEDWDLVTTVVLIQRQVGGNLAEILDKIGATIRQRQKIKGDIQTKTAQAKVSGFIVGALPVGMGLMIYIVNPGFMTKLFTFKQGWYRGWFLLVFGIIWEIIGMMIIMKIVDIEV